MRPQDIKLEELSFKEKRRCFDMLAKAVPNWDSTLSTMKKTILIANAEIATVSSMKIHMEQKGLTEISEADAKFFNVVYNAYLYLSETNSPDLN